MFDIVSPQEAEKLKLELEELGREQAKGEGQVGELTGPIRPKNGIKGPLLVHNLLTLAIPPCVALPLTDEGSS